MQDNLKQFILILSVFLILFSLSVLALVKLPGHAQKACLVGSDLNFVNLTYNFIVSAMLAYIIIKPLYFGARRFSLKSILSTGLFSFTSFCAPCVFPILGVASFSSVVFFLSSYNNELKFFLLLFVSYGVYKTHKLSKEGCRLK